MIRRGRGRRARQRRDTTETTRRRTDALQEGQRASSGNGGRPLPTGRTKAAKEKKEIKTWSFKFIGAAPWDGSHCFADGPAIDERIDARDCRINCDPDRNKNPQTHPRSIICRGRGKNLIRTDSKPKHSLCQSLVDARRVEASDFKSICYVEADTRSKAKSRVAQVFHASTGERSEIREPRGARTTQYLRGPVGINTSFYDRRN